MVCFTVSSGVTCPHCGEWTELYPYGSGRNRFCGKCGGDLSDIWIDMSNPMEK